MMCQFDGSGRICHVCELEELLIPGWWRIKTHFMKALFPPHFLSGSFVVPQVLSLFSLLFIFPSLSSPQLHSLVILSSHVFISFSLTLLSNLFFTLILNASIVTLNVVHFFILSSSLTKPTPFFLYFSITHTHAHTHPRTRTRACTFLLSHTHNEAAQRHFRPIHSPLMGTCQYSIQIEFRITLSL